MADSDPRKSRAYAKRAQLPEQSEDDPLVELARIVGEDNNYYGRSGKTSGGPEDAQTRTPLSANLESELLNELESSLSRGGAEPSAPAPRQIIRPARVQPQPEPEPEEGDELMRSIEEQLGAFERRHQSARPVQSVAPSPTNWAGRNEQLRSRHPEPRVPDTGPGPRDEQDGPRSAPVPPARRGGQGPVLRAAAAPDPGGFHGANRSEQNSVRGNVPRGRAEPNLDAPSSPRPAQRQEGMDSFAPPQRQVQLRPDRGAPPAAASRPVAGWDETADGQEPDAAPAAWVREPASGVTGLRTTYNDVEEERAPVAPATASSRSAYIEAELSRELESGYSDPTAMTNWPEPNAQDSDKPRRVHRAGAYDPDPSSSPPRPRRRARRGLLVLASLLGLALVGGGVAAYMRAGEAAPSGPPPVIAAPQGAVKIQPPAPQQQAAEETVGEAVYNRVAGAAQPTQEQVVEGAEEPEEISRIVLPPPEPPAPVTDTAEPDAAAVPRSPGTDGEANAGPRRVRTYVVRPDGTIVASEEAPASSEAAAEPAVEEPAEQQIAALEADPQPAEPARVPVTEINESPAPAGGAPQGPAPDANAAAAPEAAAVPPGTPAGADAGAALDDLAPSQAPDAPVAPPSETPPPAADAPAQVASAPASPPPAAPATGGHFVQVSSQRSMDQAQSSFAGMKQQFPSVLGPLSADIQEADLGAKGVYFRVRVGPYATRGEAITVCEKLKAAGGSCIVTQ